jgi:2-dehydro-3-deoxygluconokinase
MLARMTANQRAPRWDLVSLGEVMLRLDPGEGRIHTTRSFAAWEGGGEYNVARGLRRCFGLSTAIVTALADNPVGRLVEDLMLQGGVDLSHVLWRKYDGVGRSVRNGLNFTERGFGPRGAVGCSDRGHTATSLLVPGDVPWQKIFGEQGARWFHTGGIFAALGKRTPEVAVEAMQAAKKNGVQVSYDLNYRPSLWSAIGGQAESQRINREVVRSVDVLFGNEEDFSAALGFKLEHVDSNFQDLDTKSFREMIQRVVAEFPNISTVATTLRTAKSATINGWGAICYHKGQFYEVPQQEIEIFDRVGGGDSFASGFIYGLLADKGPEWALRCGVSHGALAMSTPGDTTMASLSEVESHMRGPNARIQR